ncbi:hypothetical protein BJ546DRAFT_825670, partial [Cryomyces antarcticus]
IPGFRTSAAFFSSLRSNLALSSSPLPPSPMSTPPSMQGSASSLPPPSPSAHATFPPANEPPDNDPLAGIPELTTYAATSEEDRLAALKLIADAVAQQRQVAGRILVFNPINLAIYGAVLAAVAQFLYKDSGDTAKIVTTYAGITMAALVIVRWATSGYILMAEEVGWDWLGKDDTALVTKFGDDIIGVCVLEWVKSGSISGGRKRGKVKGEVKAWTVGLKYRGKGVGTALLEEAVALVQSRGGDSVEFAEDHAYSKRVLNKFYNGKFDRREQRAQKALREVLDA